MANRTLTSSATVTVDESVPGQLRLNVGSGSLPAGFVRVPPGAGWSFVQGTIDDCAPGDIVLVPNEQYAQTACLDITAKVVGPPVTPPKPFTLLGEGPLSEFYAPDDLDFQGSRMQVAIAGTGAGAGTQEGITIRNVGFRHGRGLSTNRMNAIHIGPHTKSITIDGCRFYDITATCVLSAGGGFQHEKIVVKNCLAREFYECFWDGHENAKDFQVIYNDMLTTQYNGVGGVSKPYGVNIGIENDYPGLNAITDGLIAFNKIDFTGLSPVDTFPLYYSWANPVNPEYDRICWFKNWILGGHNAFYVSVLNPSGSIPSLHTFVNNKMQQTYNEAVRISTASGDASDILFLGGNEFVAAGGNPTITIAGNPITVIGAIGTHGNFVS